MYVDESGLAEHTDNTRYFVVSGVVIHENDLSDIVKSISLLKNKIFAG